MGALYPHSQDMRRAWGYAVLDDSPEPVRVRFAHITDEHIERVVADMRQAPRGNGGPAGAPTTGALSA